MSLNIMVSLNSGIHSAYEMRAFLHYECWVFTRVEYWLVYILQNRTLELEANGKEKIIH